MSTVEQDGGIHVEGEYVGHMKGLHFVPEGAASLAHERALRAASLKAVAKEIHARAQAVAASSDPDLSLSKDGHVIWQSAPIARLEAGSSIVRPRVSLIAGDQLNGADRDSVQFRLERWIQRHIAGLLEPLINLEEDEEITGLARGFAFRLVEALGVLPRDEVAEDVKSLSQEERAGLRKHGVRFGAFHVFVPALLKPAPTMLRLLLWAMWLEKQGQLDRSKLPDPPGQGLTSVAFDRSTPRGFYRIIGFRLCGPRAVRIDMLERLADLIRERVFWKSRFEGEPRPTGSVEGGGFTVVADMMSLVGCSGDEFAAILRSLGFRMLRRPAVSQAVPVSPLSTEDAPALPSESIEQPSPASGPEVVSQPAESSELAATAPADPPPAPPLLSQSDASAAPGTIEVWWPKDTGPFRHQRRHAREKHKRHSAEDRKPPVGGAAAEPRRQPRPVRNPVRSEKPVVDPNSPFAILGSLRSQLVDKKNV